MSIEKGTSSQQHVETIIHHMYMLIKDTEDSSVLKEFEACMARVKHLHQSVQVKGVKR